MDNKERRQWILNDKGLYNWQIGSKLSMSEFIKENKDEIDRIIENITSYSKN